MNLDNILQYTANTDFVLFAIGALPTASERLGLIKEFRSLPDDSLCRAVDTTIRVLEKSENL